MTKQNVIQKMRIDKVNKVVYMSMSMPSAVIVFWTTSGYKVVFI